MLIVFQLFCFKSTQIYIDIHFRSSFLLFAILDCVPTPPPYFLTLLAFPTPVLSPPAVSRHSFLPRASVLNTDGAKPEW